MSNRKRIRSDTSAVILTKSRRRCALCFGLRGDLEEKRGQIAHLDKNPSNNAEDNLVFLCLLHHDQYDSSTSQSKGLTKEEVKEYRARLYLAVDTRLNAYPTENAIAENRTKLQKKRAEIIDNLYPLLSEAIKSAEDIFFFSLRWQNPEHSIIDRASQNYQAVYTSFDKSRLYFNKNTSDKLDNLLSALKTIIGFYVYTPQDKRNPTAELIKVLHHNISRVREIFPLIEEDFRKILGS